MEWEGDRVLTSRTSITYKEMLEERMHNVRSGLATKLGTEMSQNMQISLSNFD